MKKIFNVAIIFIAVVLLFSACGGNSGDALANLGPVAKTEKQMEQEAENIPDFSITVKEDASLKVAEVPEEVTWLTADVPDWGSPNTKKGGTFHFRIPQYPENYRYEGPQGNHSMRPWMNTGAYFALMNTTDENKEWFPQLCTHWAFGADNQTVYYKLREDVRWSDGKPCTADDYVWAWVMHLDPNLESPHANKYAARVEVKKLNDYCISIKYLESNKLSKYELIDETTSNPRCKHFFDPDNNNALEKGWHVDYNWRYSPQIGAYVMDEEKTVKGELFVLKKVKDWWGDSVPFFRNLANFDYCEYKVITGGAEIEKEYFYRGELDWFPLTQAERWNEASTNKNVTSGYIDRVIYNFSPSSGMGGFFFNTKYELFKTRKARQAMYYAIDMQGMLDNVMQGELKRLHNIGMGNVWAGYDFNDHTIRKPDFDPVKAGELLAEAGYTELGSDGIRMTKDGKRASFELMYPQAEHTEKFSYIKEQAKKAGVEIELKLLQQGWIPVVFEKKFQASFFFWSYNFKPTYWQMFARENADRPNSNNVTGYSSDEMEKYLAVEDDPNVPISEKAENNKKIERLVHEEAIVIPAWYSDFGRVGVWKWIKFPAWYIQKYGGTPFSNTNFIPSYAWFDPEVKEEVEKSMAEGKTYEPKIWKFGTRYITE
ncbi:ABC transporter substrate-binding protein [Treponema pedis]|uniref:ABC transporter substrate-binding protein n=2 Tax=Treponema pedis TaxID=409322 RepID=UPI003D241DD3